MRPKRDEQCEGLLLLLPRRLLLLISHQLVLLLLVLLLILLLVLLLLLLLLLLPMLSLPLLLLPLRRTQQFCCLQITAVRALTGLHSEAYIYLPVLPTRLPACLTASLPADSLG